LTALDQTGKIYAVSLSLVYNGTCCLEKEMYRVMKDHMHISKQLKKRIHYYFLVDSDNHLLPCDEDAQLFWSPPAGIAQLSGSFQYPLAQFLAHV